MHTIDGTLLHSNIGLQYEPIFFSQLILEGLVDRMIHLWCPNLYHASYYLGEFLCTDL